MGRIDYDKLKQLETLLDDEVISQEEYNAKVAQLCSIPSINVPNVETAKAQEKKTSLATILLAVITCAVLVGGFMMYSQFNTIQRDLKYYREKTAQLSHYKSAVTDYYLDDAVCVTDTDDAYYHRLNCSSLPVEYSYWIFNVEEAIGRGYEECPNCFGEDPERYVNTHF